MKTHPPSLKDWAALFGAAFSAPIVVRTTLLYESALSPGLADTRGFFADAAICLLFAAGLAAVYRWPGPGRWIGAILTALWSLVHFANYEHIRELGSVIDFTYAGYFFDEAFLRGSALAPTHPFLMLATTACATILAAVAVGPNQRYRAWPVALAGVTTLILVAFLPPSPEVATWRRSNLFSEQTHRLLSWAPTPGVTNDLGYSGLAERDLTGTPIISAVPRARNVLLVILEGASGAYLPSLREPSGHSSSITMPALDAIARKGLSYSSFIATQRQTNRGEYAILCGDYPKLVTAEAKMTELVGAGPINCLPAAMRDAGYSTTYLQAAPLPFMMKDQFMTQAGYERVLGDEWLEKAYNRNHWGVDDRAFFESSVDLIKDLARGSDPWFLTLLTVGTHHRYNVPEDFRSESEPGSQAWAFEYLDLAVSNFIAQLEETGILEDTLVLITSDESQANEPGDADARNMLTHGWGFLIVVSPSSEPAVVEEVFSQPDIPISILDYLQLASLRPDWTGRSVFRRYDQGRNLYWGNTYLGLVAGLSPELDLTICTEDFADCIVSRTSPGALFARGVSIRSATPDERNRLQNAARRSLTTRTRGLNRRHLSLISRGSHPVIRTSGQQYVFGGQFLTLPAHSETDVEITFNLSGQSGWVEFAHNFLVNLQPHQVWSDRIEVGETLSLSYTVGTESFLEKSEFRLWISASEGEGLTLDFERAELEITVLPPASPPATSAIHGYEITGPGVD